uniref:Mucin-2 n=1 Tax=Jaculus jaculus TaxID=51337 RepID=A0A8C5NZJ2_JACJA
MLGVQLLLLLLLLSFEGALLSAGEWVSARPCLAGAPDKGWCSTWGNGHFSTFDHLEYNFLGRCNYIFTATCKAASPTFSVQLRRGPDGNISRIIVELGASVVTINKATISIKDIGVISLPYTSNGLQITPYGQNMQLVAKQLELELVVIWGPDAHLMEEQDGSLGEPETCKQETPIHAAPQVLVERKYMGRLCGLCGNFDGNADNEFLSEEGKLLEPYKYATLQKLDDPNEICVHEAIPSPPVPQTAYAKICTRLLNLVSPECNVPKDPLVRSCQEDMATCAQPGQQNCSCATLSEFSRRCSMAGQPVRSWRGPAPGQCPANQVYQECGEVCVKTCSNPYHSCSSFCTSGCFCPDGTLIDDISKNHTCVPVSQCPCMHNGVVYGPGQIIASTCQTCQCTMGHWTCTEQPCPGHCSLEGGSFITTFDARPYRFHGTCTYTLLQSSQLPDEGTLMAVYEKTGYSHSETSLAAIIYLSKKNKIIISEDEVITNNGDIKFLPYTTSNITVFRQTSTHLQMVTTFGLQLVIQLQPVFQVYITVGPQFRGQTKGLCGNFNGDTTDDFMTSMGIDESTASLFVDSWRAGNCPPALARETDPCSMSQLNKVCAETHCSMLLKKGSVFERCHAVVNPTPFYKRCVYQACNYEETFPHICAALGAYVHACSTWGVPLWGWRSIVDNCTVSCTGNRTFSYDSQACGRTCLSLSDHAAECHASAVPVDGCNCPSGTYLNHKAECVQKSQCPCLLDGNKLIEAYQSTVVKGILCYCISGRLSCPKQAEMFLASCPAPKTFRSCSQSSEDKFGAACAPTCHMLATGIDCVPTKCEPGCVCAKGLYENSNGQCVPAEECPCDFEGVSYPGGAILHNDCKTCTCSQGRWTCQQNAYCSSTCVLYGEGHVVTFDRQRFVFDGNCEYTLATDDCGANSSQPTFKILTENVICGKSGVTCSRAIKIFLGGLSITMADRNYTVSGEDPLIHFQMKPSSLHLILDVDIPGKANLTLVWNKHMSVSIKIRRTTQDALCGLCGNYNKNMKDDFETRSKYVASSELEFVNSWKENPLCGDASYVADPCSLNTFRRSWAERKCSIINSQTFAACHSKVYHLPYYEACVRDTCGCDMGGDCECLCDAVAAYAKACLDKGVCVDWRSPDFCPIYCDFYNTHTRVNENKYQYAREVNCTWHYQPCLCPGSLESFLDTNIEGCYNCSQDKYFDHGTGTCVPCGKSRTHLPHTGSRPPEVQPSTATTTTTRSYSSSSPATAVGPTYSPGLSASSSAPPSTDGETGWTTKKPTISLGGEKEGMHSGVGVSMSFPLRYGQGTSPHPSHSNSTPHHQSTLGSATTISPESTSGITSTQEAHPTSGTPSSPHTPFTTHSSPTVPVSNTAHTTGIPTGTSVITPKSTSSTTGTTVVHTTSGTPSSPHTPFTTNSLPTASVSTIPHTTGPHTGTSVHTTTTVPTPPAPQTSLTLPVSTVSSSSVTPSSQIVIIPTNSQTTASTSRTPSIIFPTTTVEGTVSTPTAPPLTSTASATSKVQTSFSTASTSPSLVTHPSPTPHHPSSSVLATTITPQTTSTVPETSVPQTISETPSSSYTPFTTHSLSTISVPNTPHTIGPSSGTSVLTTITFPTPSGPQTSFTTSVATFSTSSASPTSQVLVTPTSSHMVPSTATIIPSTTIVPTTTTKQTGPPQTSPTITSNTSVTTQAQSSLSTARTSPSHFSPPSSTPYHHQTTLTPATTTTPPKSTSSTAGTPMVHTTSGMPSSPHTPLTTHSPPTVSISNSPHTTYLPLVTSVQTTTIPIPSSPQTLLTSPVSTSSAHSLTSTSEMLSTPSSEHIMSTASTFQPPSTTLPTTSIKDTVPSLISTTTATSPAQSSFTTVKTSPEWSPPSSATQSISPPTSSSPHFSPSPTSVSPTNIPNSSPWWPGTSPTSSLPSPLLTTSSLPSGSFPASSSTSPPPTPSSSSVISTPQYTPTLSSVSHVPLFTGPTTVSHPPSVSASVPPTAASTPVNASLLPLGTSSPPSSTLSTIHVSPTPTHGPASSTKFPSTSKTTSRVPTSSPFSSQSTTSHFTSLTTQALTPGFLSSTLGVTALPSSPVTTHTTSQEPTSVFLSSSITRPGSTSPSTTESPSTEGSPLPTPSGKWHLGHPTGQSVAFSPLLHSLTLAVLHANRNAKASPPCCENPGPQISFQELHYTGLPLLCLPQVAYSIFSDICPTSPPPRPPWPLANPALLFWVPGACSLREEQQQITYHGCTANVTLGRCEGFCASSVSFNIDTQQMETRCGCCHPIGTYEKQLLLPCPDPNTPGQQLKLTVQMFSSCACSHPRCRN